VKATGIITTVVGTGVNGYNGDGGSATSTEISYAEGLALDGSGDLFFADGINNRIREVVNGPGTVITVAGNGNYGYSGDGGPAVSAQLYAPRGIALDASGNLYVADQNNNRIREILSGSIGPQMALAPAHAGSSAVGQTLTSADLPAIVAEAIRRWAAAGLSPAQVARLKAVQFVVTDLSATTPGDVGWSLNGVVELDATAAGYGWFVDPTPQSDSEFSSGEPPAGMDLLTVVMHELGHQLGLQDLNDASHPIDLMSEGLTPGVRRAYVSVYDRELLGLQSLEAFHGKR
jgi:NHL repeat